MMPHICMICKSF
ncbi:hypothetical protein CAEBREN_25431 [Caenorhabditis brenneri]|uniref:Uncharacterized protein n=1 Tax=Caenorhabditis brenneri TaxID=135651 RepID=G0PCX5_CAEBE|nr:hypothetical protein CAEBREN_25431 [Caenorhabditis brenneri]